ncbi:MAG TPA: hypothetical protein VGP73_11180 [Thermoanaerobaculia bacterium]
MENSQQAMLAAWDQALDALVTHQEDLASFEAYGVELAAAADNLRHLQARRNRLRDELQQTTAEVHALFACGNDLLVRLRAGVRSRYGIHDDRLRDFGIKPQTGRKSSKARIPGRRAPAVPCPDEP